MLNFINTISSSLQKTLRQTFTNHNDLFMVLVSLLIGILAGYGNLIFRYLIEFFQDFFYGATGGAILSTLQQAPFYKIILLPAIGGLLVGLISITFKSAKGHGVPDVIKAVTTNRTISPFVAIVKSISSSITIGSGGSVGREGPIVQIGAAIGSGVGKILNLPREKMKSVIACGASGGLAATFNAPIGGAMFAAEVILGGFGIKTFTPIIVSSVIATVISRTYLGNNVTFEAPTYLLVSPLELVFYIILGLLCAIVGVMFIRIFYSVEEKFEALTIPSFIKPALGGLLFGFLALLSRRVMGVGYETIFDILNGNISFFILISLVFMKMIASALILGSGGSGGLFVPALFIGAALGGGCGEIFHYLFPTITAGSGAYGLVAMGAMLAATMRAPLTAILIIFEITQSYEIILPLMLATIIANVAANWLEKETIFTWILAKEGIRIKKIDEDVLNTIKVKDVMLTKITTFSKSTPFKKIMEDIQRSAHMYYPVLNENNSLTGMLSLDDIKSILFEEGLQDILVADEICTKKDLIYISPNDDLSEAIRKMGSKDLGAIPVVEKHGDELKLKGLVRRSDILLTYNKAVLNTYTGEN